MAPAWLGAHEGVATPYVPRAGDEALENRLGSDAALVVVVGEPAAGASRSAARAAHRMLGGQRVIAPPDTGTADVAELIATAGREQAPVVWLDGAPLGVLDQIVPAVVAGARRAGVRLVVTTRPELVAARHPHDETPGLLQAATAMSLGGLTVAEAAGGPLPAGRVAGYATLGGREAAAFLVPCGWSTLVPLAVARVAATWDVLGVPRALTPERLVVLVPEVLDALDVPASSPKELRSVVDRCVRGPVSGLQVLSPVRRRGEVHLRPHPLLRAGRVEASSIGDLLDDLLDDPAERHAVARAALLVDDVRTAAVLLDGADAGGLDPSDALRVALAMGRTPGAQPWFALGAESDDEAERKTAQAGGAWLLDHYADRHREPWTARAEARRLMEDAVPDQRAMLWLGRRERDRGDAPSARAWWVRAARGPDADLAARAAWRVAEVDVAAGDDAAALPFLEQARDGRGWGARALTSRLAGVHRRLGQHEEADAAQCSLLTGIPVDDDPVLLELGRSAEERGDLAAARRWYRRAWLDEAGLRLAELDLAAGYLSAVQRWVEDRRGTYRFFAEDPECERFRLRLDDPDHQAWGAWIAGELAYRLDDLDEARRWFASAQDAPGGRGRRAAARLAELASTPSFD